MKGTPDTPRCGFSMRVVQALDALGVEYGAIDVLPALQPLREVTAEISDWRTFPQLYANGELSRRRRHGQGDVRIRRARRPARHRTARGRRRPRRRLSRARGSRPRCRSNSLPRARVRPRRAGRQRPSYTWKEEPQPQAATTFGLLTWKPGALQAFHVVDLAAEDELHRDLVDDDGDAVDHDRVVIVLPLVEGERVLEAGAAAASHRDAERLARRPRSVSPRAARRSSRRPCP